MSSGMDMMIKSMFGIDPGEMKAKLEQLLATVQNTLKHFDNRILELEKQNAEILALLRGKPEIGESNDGHKQLGYVNGRDGSSGNFDGGQSTSPTNGPVNGGGGNDTDS